MYTGWLKENLKIFHADNAGRLDWSVIESQLSVIEKVYNDIQGFDSEIRSNSEAINERFKCLRDTVGWYVTQLDSFQRDRNEENFALLQYRLLSFIDNYLLLWQEIDNIDKT